MNRPLLCATALLLLAGPLSAAPHLGLFWRLLGSPKKEEKPAPPAPVAPVRASTPQKPKPSTPPAPPKKKLSPEQIEANVRLQVFLDTALFSPGKIDGRDGEIVTRAILRYQRSKGLPETGKPDQLPVGNQSPYTAYTLTPEDAKSVGNLPSATAEQSKRHYLPYSSFQEFLAERFHCSPYFLEEINPGKNLSQLRAGDTVTVPAVEPFRLEEIKSMAALPEIPEFKTRKIRVLRNEKILELVEEEKLIAAVPITTGSSTLPTPPGKWRILGISTLPTFRWDAGVLNHGVRTSSYYMLPPGPNNPVGVAWCGLNRPGIGIHGTNQPDTIGRAFSHGCIRVANWDISRLIWKISPGITVEIE
jgi:lipoprotein-anchoring transpeptidase ErfK/SrfK